MPAHLHVMAAGKSRASDKYLLLCRPTCVPCLQCMVTFQLLYSCAHVASAESIRGWRHKLKYVKPLPAVGCYACPSALDDTFVASVPALVPSALAESIGRWWSKRKLVTTTCYYAGPPAAPDLDGTFVPFSDFYLDLLLNLRWVWQPLESGCKKLTAK